MAGVADINALRLPEFLVINGRRVRANWQIKTVVRPDDRFPRVVTPGGRWHQTVITKDGRREVRSGIEFRPGALAVRARPAATPRRSPALPAAAGDPIVAHGRAMGIQFKGCPFTCARANGVPIRTLLPADMARGGPSTPGSRVLGRAIREHGFWVVYVVSGQPWPKLYATLGHELGHVFYPYDGESAADRWGAAFLAQAPR